MPSLKMQKKQNRPRSRSRPRLIPIKSEIGAVPEFSPWERRKAVNNRPRTMAREIAVLIFWLLFQSGLEAP
jgi:hypothetical protein